MNPRADIWNVLHDGGIAEIKGSVPAAAEIRVSLKYLREMFSAGGEDIVVHLSDCSTLSMKIREGEVTTDNAVRMVGIAAEILSTEFDDVPAHIITTHGELDIDFEVPSLSVDGGRQISFEELCEACENYWNRWENDAK